MNPQLGPRVCGMNPAATYRCSAGIIPQLGPMVCGIIPQRVSYPQPRASARGVGRSYFAPSSAARSAFRFSATEALSL